MNIVKHISVIVISLFLILGVPFMNTDYFRSLISDEDVDSVSSASVVIDQPSGNYVVLINLEKHTDEENLGLWHDFFEGEDVSFIFEDIVCTVAGNDVNGTTMAQSFRSRLPENQMKIKSEDATLMLSKAEYNKFDVIIMSEEIAEMFSAETLFDNENVDVIRVSGETIVNDIEI